jgi:hypothetical protein
MAVDTLKMVIEADATSAINNLNKYNATQKAVVKDTQGIAKSSEEASKGFAQLRVGGEGLNLGFMKIAGSLGAVLLGIRMLYMAGKDAEEMFAKLHPEMQKAEGSLTQFTKASEVFKSSFGSLISEYLKPFRIIISEYVIAPLSDAITKLVGMDSTVKNLSQSSLTTLGTISSDPEKIQQMLNHEYQINKMMIQRGISDPRNPNFLTWGIEQYAQEQKLQQLRDALAEAKAMKARAANADNYASSKGEAGGPDVGIWNQGEMRKNAIFDTGGSVMMFEAMAEAARGLPADIKETVVALNEMQKTLLNMGANAAFDALFEAGRTGSNIGSSIITSLAKALPQQLLSAALSTIAANPMNPIGWVMLAASGLAAFAGGAITGGLEKSGASAAGSSNGGSTGSVNIVNVYGNVWAAGDLAASTAGVAGRW